MSKCKHGVKTYDISIFVNLVTNIVNLWYNNQTSDRVYDIDLQKSSQYDIRYGVCKY